MASDVVGGGAGLEVGGGELKRAVTPRETNLHSLAAVFDSGAPGLVHKVFAVHPRHREISMISHARTIFRSNRAEYPDPYQCALSRK